MNPKIILGLSLALFIMAAEVSGRCTKGGTDVCGCSEKIFKAVKPKRPDPASSSKKVVCKVVEEDSVEEFKPIGDVCGCSNVEVSPAILPKPKCWSGKHDKSREIVYGSEESEEGKYIRAPKHMHDFETEVEEERAPNHEYVEVKVPVDTVSMNIVQELQRKEATSKTDEQLFFGFSSLPSEKPVLKVKGSIPEEDLFTFEKRIVELKPHTHVVKCGNGPEGDVVIDEKRSPVYLSYGDLGFQPIQGARPNFVKKQCHYKEDSDEAYGSNEYGKKYYKKRVYSDEVEDTKEESDEVVYKVPVRKSVFIKKLGHHGHAHSSCDC